MLEKGQNRLEKSNPHHFSAFLLLSKTDHRRLKTAVDIRVVSHELSR
jgi:hypothetical protein